MSNDNLPKRGDIWLTNFDPTIGSEIRKIRPAIIISSDGIGRLPIKLIAPTTERNGFAKSRSLKYNSFTHSISSSDTSIKLV
ncbi:MAG: type II toxin-antitoxin system PemK/MazF family toxin [Okeania sp. SIO3B5]|uniref:type II toxin-antitoxin system PemK/MazF family toxin n=1 Tax=Okeania sp. SIO3B5 TaxID=2607811 RepID=UPI00140116D9|nr:type II toxin-antitoxin system PemK/MazF family toxin [Okeania sp. SIO3B5]NEO53468.1 type II toxin-antitoxin system PemK/MazF family toxin [Okeania sp. SIO3B5]